MSADLGPPVQCSCSPFLHGCQLPSLSTPQISSGVSDCVKMRRVAEVVCSTSGSFGRHNSVSPTAKVLLTGCGSTGAGSTCSSSSSARSARSISRQWRPRRRLPRSPPAAMQSSGPGAHTTLYAPVTCALCSLGSLMPAPQCCMWSWRAHNVVRTCHLCLLFPPSLVLG